jgi:hypothetical protein
MIWGTDATSAGVMGVAAICGAEAPCGTGEAGDGWDAGPTGALAASGVVAGLGWVAAFGVAMMSAPAGTLAAGTVATVLRSTCPSTVLWSYCWCMTRVANTLTLATTIARRTSKNLSDRAQNRCI